MTDKILVTGSDGFIGSHLVEELVKQGKKVKAFVYYNSFNSWGWLDKIDPKVLKEVEIFSGDIRDPYGVRKSMEGCNRVFHLAALIAIPYSYHSPSTYVDTNINGTLNIVNACKDLNIESIVHTSTSEVYGTAQFVPITEEHPLKGQSPYSASKIGADQIAYSFYASFDLPVKIIRPFNTYGPRQSARAVIPTIISQVAAGKEEIMLGALKPTRDFNFVEDTVKGFLAVDKSQKTIGEVVNVGSNFEVSIADTAKSIAEVMGRDILIKQDSQRMRPSNSEVERLWASNDKVKELTDWSPEFAGLEGFKRGLKITADWFTEAENLKHYKHDIYNI